MSLCSYEAKCDQYTLESLFCSEESCYLNTLLPCNRMLREKSVVLVRKVVPCILIKMITNSISCLHCLDVSSIFYIVYIVSIFASAFLFAEAPPTPRLRDTEQWVSDNVVVFVWSEVWPIYTWISFFFSALKNRVIWTHYCLVIECSVRNQWYLWGRWCPVF